jgi:hypothetical protein
MDYATVSKWGMVVGLGCLCNCFERSRLRNSYPPEHKGRLYVERKGKTMTRYLTLILLLLTCGIGRAQIDTPCSLDPHGKPVNCVGGGVPESDPAIGAAVGPLIASTTNVITFPPVPTWMESVQNGTYTAIFSDPGNLWRCYMTSVTLDDPRNVFGSEASTLTITCVKPHPVKP